jgi:hypothetical protein
LEEIDAPALGGDPISTPLVDPLRRGWMCGKLRHNEG